MYVTPFVLSSSESSQQQKAVQKKGSDENKCNLSFPSIHAGPKAFAQMTGLGADGRPNPQQANNTQLPLCEYCMFIITKSLPICVQFT